MKWIPDNIKYILTVLEEYDDYVSSSNSCGMLGGVKSIYYNMLAEKKENFGFEIQGKEMNANAYSNWILNILSDERNRYEKIM